LPKVSPGKLVNPLKIKCLFTIVSGDFQILIIAGGFGDTDYDNFTDEQKERYNKFGKAFEDKIVADYPDVIPPYPGNE